MVADCSRRETDSPDPISGYSNPEEDEWKRAVTLEVSSGEGVCGEFREGHAEVDGHQGANRERRTERKPTGYSMTSENGNETRNDAAPAMDKRERKHGAGEEKGRLECECLNEDVCLGPVVHKRTETDGKLSAEAGETTCNRKIGSTPGP